MEQIQETLNAPDEADTGDLISGYDSSTPSQSHYPHDGTINSVSISMDAYKRLTENSIDLLKANKIFEKLNQTISKKDEEINKIKNINRNSNMDHLSPVIY